jgi:hypothetical protein
MLSAIDGCRSWVGVSGGVDSRLHSAASLTIKQLRTLQPLECRYQERLHILEEAFSGPDAQDMTWQELKAFAHDQQEGTP